MIGLKGREGFLISEAVRGEGATLHDQDGERFVDELKPRDHVARAIFNLPSRSAELDMTMVDPGRFPNIIQALREAGLDPMTTRVPVAPASHYVMGGIVTDLDGKALDRLYAVGECACTGLHGANRLASNSLSECFVFGRRAALKGLDEATPTQGDAIEADVAAPTRETREAVWRLAGLERDAERLTALTSGPLSARPPGRRERPQARGDARRSRSPRVPGDRPGPRRHAHDHRPRHRDPPIRGVDGLLIDWGGVLTHSVLGSFAAFDRAEGLPANTIRDAFLGDARPLLEGLENGELGIPEFERRLAQHLGLDPTDLAARLMAHARPDTEMRAAVKRLPRPGHPDRPGEQLLARIGLRHGRRLRRDGPLAAVGFPQAGPAHLPSRSRKGRTSATSVRVRR